MNFYEMTQAAHYALYAATIEARNWSLFSVAVLMVPFFQLIGLWRKDHGKEVSSWIGVGVYYLSLAAVIYWYFAAVASVSAG